MPEPKLGATAPPHIVQEPLVTDRAMGKTALVAKMIEMRIRFLTAITAPELSSYATRLPRDHGGGLGTSGLRRPGDRL